MPTAPPKACLVCGEPTTVGSYCEKHRQENPGARARVVHDKYRAQQPYRKLYQTAQWDRTKLFVLNRDHYLCRIQRSPLCKHHGGDQATVVDHIIDHNGDVKLFYDVANCRAACKPCHDARTGGEHGFKSKGGTGGGIDWDAPFSIPETA